MTYEIDASNGPLLTYQYQVCVGLVDRISEAEQVVERKYIPNLPMKCQFQR